MCPSHCLHIEILSLPHAVCTFWYDNLCRTTAITSSNSQTAFSNYRVDHYGVGSVPSRRMLAPREAVRYYRNFEVEGAHGATPLDVAMSSPFLDHRLDYDADVCDLSMISLSSRRARFCL